MSLEPASKAGRAMENEAPTGTGSRETTSHGAGTRWRRRAGLALAGLLVLAASGAALLQWWRARNIGLVQQGVRLASERGCLSCHGEGGRRADPEGTLGIGSVPSFDHDDVAEHARSAAEIREWILDGQPRRLRDDVDAEPPLIRMPAWRGRLSGREVEALVAWVLAVSDFEPVPAHVAQARGRIEVLGCFACHGPQGRSETPNPGSLKGYVPSWSGADYPELVRDERELREWVRDGAPRRLRGNPVAAWFLRRQTLRMPAFGDKVGDEDLRRIADYIRWLRSEPAAAH